MSDNEHAQLSDVALEKELLGMWRRALKNDTLSIDDDFFECGGDSLLAVQMLLELEKLTGQTLPQSIVFETGTVRQLLKRIITTDKDQTQVSVLVGSDQGKLIHLFHGDFTHGGVWVKTFSKMLGTDYRINAMPPHLPQEGTVPNSVEEMAKERLPKILEKQPKGPYILLGQCNGAVVGFEVGRLLVSMGKEVKAVVMVDPFIMSVRKSAQFIFKTAEFFMVHLGIQKDKQREHLLWISRRLLILDRRHKDFWRRALFFFLGKRHRKRSSDNKLRSFSRPEKFSPEWKKRQHIKKHYFDIFFDYKPLPLNVPVLYITSRFSGGAWRRISRETVFFNIYRGRHIPWNETYSPELVNKIREFINR